MPTVTYDHETSEDTQAAPMPLELEEPGRSHLIEGPYGALLATMAAPSADPDAHSYTAAPASLSRPTPTRLDRAIELLALVPLAVWKRVALYSFLFMLFGNLLRCGGLALSTNATCLFVLVLGVAGALASAQRNP